MFMPRKQATIAGFTLLEILVALFIFTIIAIIMTRALHMVFETQARTNDSSARLAALQVATLYFENDITQAVDRPIRNGNNEKEAAFIGKKDKISFTHGGNANPLGQLERSTLQRVSYSMDNHQFIRETWQVLDQISTSKSDQRHLLDKITDLRFEYLDDKGKASDSWPPADKSKSTPLPNAVRIHLTLAHWGMLTQTYIIPGKAFVTHQ
jgi:general secretion pathway protein J